MKNKIEQSNKNAHAKYVNEANKDKGIVLKRHLENMVATYGANYTTQVILRVLEEEIKQELKKQRAVDKKVG